MTDLRILLWDIDGTLVRSAKATAFTEYTRPVLEAVFGTAGRIDEVPLTGMTDLQHIVEALASEGFTQTDIWESLQAISTTTCARSKEPHRTARTSIFYQVCGKH